VQSFWTTSGGWMPLVPLRSWGTLTARGSCLLKLFLWTVVSEDFASLAVLSLGWECLSWKVQKFRFCPMGEGTQHIRQIKSQCQCELFSQIKQQRDYFFKWLLGWPN
jgi:hypothetical protein